MSFEYPFFFKRVYVIVERELRCRRVVTFAAIFIVPVEVVSFFVAVSPHTYHDRCPSIVATEKVRTVPPRLFDKEETTEEK